LPFIWVFRNNTSEGYAGLPTPSSEPDVQLSLHPALQGQAFLTRHYHRVCIPFQFALHLPTFREDYKGLVFTPGRLPSASLRHVAGFPDLRLLWRLRLRSGFHGRLLAYVLRSSLPRSR